MKFEHTKVFNVESALRGMRNPLESWDRGDSSPVNGTSFFAIGKRDLKLARKLIKAGTDHRKFLRQIFISVDISAPLYWWKEFDTYKVGTVANSTSTMHKLHARGLVPSDFEWDRVTVNRQRQLMHLNKLIANYNNAKDKEEKQKYWRELIQDLPSSFIQKRTITMNFENIYAMYNARKHHKLDEWSVDFIEWAESLPYFKAFFL